MSLSSFRIPPPAKRRSKRKTPNYVESGIQKSFIEWLRLQHPRIGKVTFSVPNGAKRSWELSAVLKAEGLTPGVPDIFIAYPYGGYPGMFIEFKSPGGKLSDSQKIMIPLLREGGYRVEVSDNLEESIRLFKNYIGVGR
jgi:VRR-NUC domain